MVGWGVGGGVMSKGQRVRGEFEGEKEGRRLRFSSCSSAAFAKCLACASNTVRLQGERLSRDPSGAAAQIDGNEWPIGQLRQSVIVFSII